MGQTAPPSVIIIIITIIIIIVAKEWTEAETFIARVFRILAEEGVGRQHGQTGGDRCGERRRIAEGDCRHQERKSEAQNFQMDQIVRSQ